MRRLAILPLLCMVACAAPERAPSPTVAEVLATAPVTVKLIAFNDFHGRLEPPDAPTTIPAALEGQPDLRISTGGVAWLAAQVKALRQGHPLSIVVGSGDLIGATPLISSLLKHESTVAALGDAGLEFSSVGNHEFDRGVGELVRLQGLAKFQYLAANVRKRSDGKAPFPAWAVKRFKLPDGRELPVAFIGVGLRETPGMVNGEDVPQYEFLDEADTANAAAREVRAAGIETIVLLVHQGGYTTQARFDDNTCPGFYGPILAIADKLDPAIDLIVSGHTHRTYICRRNGRLITSAGLDGRFLTDIDMTVDPATGAVLRTDAHMVPVINDRLPNPIAAEYASLPPDAALQKRVAGWAAEVAPLASRTVARVSGNIIRRRSESNESQLGSLVADAQLAATAPPAEGRAQMVFVNSGSMRADLSPADGKVTYENAYGVNPYGNYLVTLTLTGAQIDTLLESQWQGGLSLLQVSSGLIYRWSGSAPAGSKVAPGDILLNGQPLQQDGLYRVTVSDFLSNGGDGYEVLKQGRDRVVGPLDVEALEAYLNKHSPVAPPPSGRIAKLP